MRPLLLLVVLQLVALWPVWRWYGLRITDIAGDEYGFLAFGTAVLLLGWRRQRQHWTTIKLAPPIALLVVYALFYPIAPMEIRAGFAFVSLAFTLSLLATGEWPRMSMIGLFLLALPLIPSLQFYLGYPMRLVVAWLAAGVLNLAGLGVGTQGACLTWAGNQIWIDAPCSGVRMLWTSGYLLCTVALLYRLSALRTSMAGILVVPLVLAANALRAASLFYIEAGILPAPAWVHGAVGIMVFCVVALAVVLLVAWVRRGQCTAHASAADTATPRVSTPAPQSIVACIFVATCLCAGLMPFARVAHEQKSSGIAFPGWPREWDGRPLEQKPLSEKEDAFAKTFPGRTGRFSDGQREMIIRWVTEPTRKLHPASDCLRAFGAHVTARPLHIDNQGTAWGSLEVVQHGRRFWVHEQFRDAAGGTWSDVSSWYWAAVRGKTTGPWWVYDILEPQLGPANK